LQAASPVFGDVHGPFFIRPDPDARLPEFLRRVHKHTASCINATRGRWENLWASEQPSIVRLEDDGDVLDKLAYCLANPVEAGLVAHGRQWPGLRSAPGDVAGREYVVAAVDVLLRKLQVVDPGDDLGGTQHVIKRKGDVTFTMNPP
jgi:hypothetical protein